MFEKSLNINLYYITYFKNIIIESQYLKPIFKNKKYSISIWKAIILRLKSLV